MMGGGAPASTHPHACTVLFLIIDHIHCKGLVLCMKSKSICIAFPHISVSPQISQMFSSKWSFVSELKQTKLSTTLHIMIVTVTHKMPIRSVLSRGHVFRCNAVNSAYYCLRIINIIYCVLQQRAPQLASPFSVFSTRLQACLHECVILASLYIEQEPRKIPSSN